MSGRGSGVVGVPARILLSGGSFKVTKTFCPEASRGSVGVPARVRRGGGPGEDFAEWGVLHIHENLIPRGLRRLGGGPGEGQAWWGSRRGFC